LLELAPMLARERRPKADITGSTTAPVLVVCEVIGGVKVVATVEVKAGARRVLEAVRRALGEVRREFLEP
jgi:hypothetical protein